MRAETAALGVHKSQLHVLTVTLYVRLSIYSRLHVSAVTVCHHQEFYILLHTKLYTLYTKAIFDFTL